ncbi:hypothetical protein IWX78_002418 [Mycetocola sp. CAN_C7]|uniref:DUF4012 domain-containing protein n=1 Tax=Mycetocola sp. CAN_C7 TaxID=2787724 RepID=UPI0018CA6198
MNSTPDVPWSARSRPFLLWALLALLLALIGAGLWIGIRGASAADELSTARSLAGGLQGEMAGGNTDAAAGTLEKAGGHTATAVALTSDPVWRAGEILPFAGPNLTAVREAAQAVDDLVTDVAAPLLPLADELDAGSFAGASVPLQPLVDAAPRAAAARSAAEGLAARVAEIETSTTLPFVRSAVDELSVLVDQVEQTVGAIDRAVTLLPGMLGADGRRNYLVLIQNNAELRASGGLPGATAVLAANAGDLSLAEHVSSMDYPRLAEPALPLTPAEAGLYGTILGRYVQDVNLTPDFSRTGELAKAMAEPVVGMRIDGVLAIDPYVLSYVLEATGPVELAGGRMLTSDNAVQMLLSDVYTEIEEPADQDAFFASVTAAVFSALTTGEVDPARLLAAVVQGGDEGRVRIWSADADEQSVLAETALAGVRSTGTDPVLGVYLNDATGGKMGYYLDGAVTLSCAGDEQRVRVELTSDAPVDAATSLPGFVTGDSVYGVPAGSIRTQVLLVLPPGARVVTRADAVQTVVRDDSGRVIVSVFIEVTPGESGHVTVDYTDAAATTVEVTPGLVVNSPERGQAGCS